MAQQVKDPATVAWVAAMEQVASLACDLPHTMGAAKKKKKVSWNCGLIQSLHEWFTSKAFMGLLAVFSSSPTFGLRASVPCWLLAGSLPQFLLHGSHLRQHITWQLASIRMSKQESKRFSTWATDFLWANFRRDIPSYFPYSIYYKHFTSSSPLRGKEIT